MIYVINPAGMWDDNGILTGYRDIHSVQIGITNIPQIPLDGNILKVKLK